MSRRISKKKVIGFFLCVLLIVVALIWSFPIIYMVISSFKPEEQVGVFGFIFKPTLDNYKTVISPTFFAYLKNSIITTAVTVGITLVLAVPTSYALAYRLPKRTDGTYFWFISTTFLPAIAMIVPIYVIFNRIGLIDTTIGLVILYIGAGVPMMIWIVTNHFREIPIELVESATVDGATKVQTFFRIQIPLIKNGLISAAMLIFILTWNEFFYAITVTYSNSATLPVYMSRWMTQQGYYWGKMCASGTLIVIIPIVFGFFAQKSLVEGMTLGSVKG